MSAPVIKLYVHHVAFDLVAAGSMLLVDDFYDGVEPLLFTVMARTASSYGTSSITVDVILNGGRYERFTLTRHSDVPRSIPNELSARLVLQ